uniref:hypothetical protein n=1 Tax=Fluoribacter gormanii TaxID=464 RepID=UPI001A93E13A
GCTVTTQVVQNACYNSSTKLYVNNQSNGTVNGIFRIELGNPNSPNFCSNDAPIYAAIGGPLCQ